MKRYLLFYCLNVLFQGYIFCSTSAPVQALVKVPLCDLISDSCKSICDNKNVVVYYNNLPLCGQQIKDCPRIHQLLYNEIVTIIEEKGDECLVKVPSIFYERDENSDRFDTYWTLKKNLITFDALSKSGIKLDSFPDSLNYVRGDARSSKKKIVTLLMPFYEPKTKQYYSAGTRFVRVYSKGHSAGHTVYLFDAASNKVITTVIPQKLSKIENNRDSFQKKVSDYIALLRSWVTQEGFIPYVWGGSSYSKGCKKDEIQIINAVGKEYYHRLECTESPKSGFDCAGLIARAAQICGLPYYFKNSTTIKKNLVPVSEKEKLREGDILWIPGHVMVVANIKQNTIIEARGYNHGYGKVHEIALNKVFQGVESFDQLIDLYKKKKPLQRLNNVGVRAHQVDSYVLLSLATLSNLHV